MIRFLLVLLLSTTPALAQEIPLSSQRLDRAFQAYWSAPNTDEARSAAQNIIAQEPPFADAYERLQRGKTYSLDVPKGKLFRTHTINGVDHHYMLFIPENYDPTRPWPVRWDLHGGMGQPEWKAPDGSWSPGWAALDQYHSSYITVIPAGWWDSMWWEASQIDNFRRIQDELKRTWNVDENKVYIFGNSDGAIGAWFHAFRFPDPWAYYIGYVGFPARLTNRALRADGQMHLSNLDHQHFYLHNGVHDRIIDIQVMRSYLDVIQKGDAQILYEESSDAGHDLRLTEEEQLKPFRHFRTTRRDPLPDRLSWATERTDRYNRRLWLVIDELAPEHAVDETNILPRIYGNNVPRTPPPPAQPWGRVALQRDGNTVYATTTGVQRFSLLLSPEIFDFAQPVRVVVDGQTLFDQTVTPSLRTLFKWAAHDNDRQMLFGAEVEIEVH